MSLHTIETPDGKLHHIIRDRDLYEIIEAYCGHEILDLIPETQEHTDEEYYAEEQEHKAAEGEIEVYRNVLCEIRDLADELLDYFYDNTRWNKAVVLKKVTNIAHKAVEEL